MDGELLQMPLSPYGTNSYEKFAILLNSPGQVYTIGSRYKGRVGNEQFIQCTKKFVWKTHLQIKVDENREFWVRQTPTALDDNELDDDDEFEDWYSFRSLAEKKISILNGRILKEDWERLNFGDVLSLYYPRQFMEPVDESRLPVFYFKKVTNLRVNEEALPRKEIIPVSPKFLPHENDLILARIFSFMTTHDLKKCRMVSKRWRDIAQQPFRQKLYPLIAWKEDLSHPQTGLKLFYFSETFKHLKPTNLTLQLPSREKFIDDVGSPEHLDRYNKFVDDIQHFLIDSDLQIEVLHLSGQIVDKEDAKMWENLLQRFSKTLKHLYIQWFSVTLKKASKFVIDFPHLKKFTLNTPLQANGIENTASAETFYKTLAKSVRNVESLEIRFDFDTRGHSVLPFFCNSFQPKYLTTVNFTTLTRLQLNFLLKLDSHIQLKNLSLGYTRRSVQYPGDFEEKIKSVPDVKLVVSKFSKSLERLRIVLWKDNFTFTFPVLGKLRHLYLSVRGSDFDVQWQESKYLLFSKHLPVIEKVVLINQTVTEKMEDGSDEDQDEDYDFFRDDGNLLNRHFYDKNMSEGSKTLRHFEFTYGCQGDMGDYDDWADGQTKTLDEFITKLPKLEFWSLNGYRRYDI